MVSSSGSDPLLDDIALAAVDHRGQPASRASTGRWRSGFLIVAVEIAEHFSFFGVSANLISYLTGPLGVGLAKAASSINIWNGVTHLLPLLAAAIADSWLGRYRTILLANLLYILSLGMLALSALLSSPGSLQMAAFYASLYMVALAQAGHKPCVQAFAADQFDESDPREAASRCSFFNWWYFSICAGTAVTLVPLVYIQDNVGWDLGFGIPCIVMALALPVFLLGTRTYRYYQVDGKQKQFARAAEAFTAWTNMSTTPLEEEHGLVISSNAAELLEDAKNVLRLFPIWATCVLYAVAFSQSSTFFTKQAATLDRHVGHNLQIPSAALQIFISITIIILMPVYDCIIVPMARSYTGASSSVTLLHRIGTGMLLSLVSMAVAALVETRQLRVAMDAGIVDMPEVPVPMTLWWMLPQYVLFGAADVFTMVGMREFFYDQVPDEMRSIGLALYLSIFGIGNFVSSGLVSGIDRVTSERGHIGFSDNLNRGHLEYFYWLIAVLSAIELLVYIFFAGKFKYKKKKIVTAD